MGKVQKCANPNCDCAAKPGGNYCSTYCEDADVMDTICNCGHAECELPVSVGESE